MMHNFGVMARKNDIFTRTFLGIINGMLRSKVGSACLLTGLLFLGGGLVWDASLDLYLVRNGERVTVPVVEEYSSRQGGYTTRFRYPGASSGNPLHFFQSLFIDSDGASDIGVAHTRGTSSSCASTRGCVTVAYLPHNPQIYAVVEDQTGFLFFLIGSMCLAACVALAWNLKRLGCEDAPVQLPGWPEPCRG